MKTKKNKTQKTFFKNVHTFFTMKNAVSAVILAGGSSLRFGGDTPKQFLPLCGKPLIVHSMLAFEKTPCVKEIIIVCRQDDAVRYEVMAKEYGITKFKKAVVGGATRQESSMAGLNATNRDIEHVLIHDGARPLVTPKNVQDVAKAAKRYRAACAASVSRDTVKISDKDGFISRTEDRSFVYLAATPQGFYKPLLEACAYSAMKENFSVTDDASLLEHYAYPVKLVDCTSENIKITTRSDLIMAEAIMKCREESEDTV